MCVSVHYCIFVRGLLGSRPSSLQCELINCVFEKQTTFEPMDQTFISINNILESKGLDG